MRLMIRIVTVLLAVGTTLAQAEEPFEVAVISHSDQFPLGVLFEVSIEARNVSGRPVTVAFGKPPLFLEVTDDTGGRLKQCPELEMLWKRGTTLRQVETVWKHRQNLRMCVRVPGRYEARVVMRSSWVEPKRKEGEPEPWLGTVVSRTVTFDVIEPQGVDREAYDAFNGEPLPILDRECKRERLLDRFPTSTYAAYAIWKRWGISGFHEWKTPEDREATLKWLSKNLDEEYLTYRMPCTEDGQPDATAETLLKGRIALNCRDRWLSTALRNHPQIWFADEIRFKLAIDRYRHGESESAMAELELLAEHGKQHIASKAGELLAVLKAEEMLEEKEE